MRALSPDPQGSITLKRQLFQHFNLTLTSDQVSARYPFPPRSPYQRPVAPSRILEARALNSFTSSSSSSSTVPPLGERYTPCKNPNGLAAAFPLPPAGRIDVGVHSAKPT